MRFVSNNDDVDDDDGDDDDDEYDGDDDDDDNDDGGVDRAVNYNVNINIIAFGGHGKSLTDRLSLAKIIAVCRRHFKNGLVLPTF